jgi:hypothetical protein
MPQKIRSVQSGHCPARACRAISQWNAKWARLMSP